VRHWFDGHLDLTYVSDHGRDLTTGGRREKAPASSAKSEPLRADVAGACEGLSFPSLKKAGVTAAISTLFVRKRIPASAGVEAVDGPYCFSSPDEAFHAAVRQVEMHRAWERQGLIESPTPSAHHPAASGQANSTALRTTLAIEGAACLRNLDDLDYFIAAGVRMVSLAWAEGSLWAGGDQSGGDVTPAGLELIARLDELAIVHDVSHLSEQAFWTLMKKARGRKVASHSNCLALLPGARVPQRHLSDDQVKALADAGGMVGINLFARFLIGPEELKRRRATASDVLRHIQHLADTAGRKDFVGLGSDMESGFGPELMPLDVQGPGHLERIAEGLLAVGWSEHEVAGFCFENWARVLAW